MKRNIESAVLCGAVLLTLGAAVALAAGGDTITEVNVTPNPGGAASTVQGSGTYTLGKNNAFRNVYFKAQNTGSKQLNSNAAAAAMGNWKGTLDVVAGNYNCWGTLYSQNGNTLNITSSNTINVNVK